MLGQTEGQTEQHHPQPPSSPPAELAQPGEDDDVDVLASLQGHGISPRAAQTLAQGYPAERIQEKVELLDYLQQVNSPLVAKNPSGWLRRAIEENYYPPPEYLQAKAGETRRRQQEETQARTEQEELRRRADELAIPPEQRAEHWLASWERARAVLRKAALTPAERAERLHGLVASYTSERDDFFAAHAELRPPIELGAGVEASDVAGDALKLADVDSNGHPAGLSTPLEGRHNGRLLAERLITPPLSKTGAPGRLRAARATARAPT